MHLLFIQYILLFFEEDFSISHKNSLIGIKGWKRHEAWTANAGFRV